MENIKTTSANEIFKTRKYFYLSHSIIKKRSAAVLAAAARGSEVNEFGQHDRVRKLSFYECAQSAF